jgi:FkbM family methyltransferase
LLEEDFNWTGILAEPAISWREELIKNRPTARLDFRGVWRESGASITFLESAEPELSTIESFRKADLHAKSRKRRKDTYQVKTISLLDLLIEHQAPKIIDYLSIDTEGSEYEILSTFDFDKFTFSIITVEHNFTSNREEIFTLLSENGYERRLSDISSFDDWYVFVGPKK